MNARRWLFVLVVALFGGQAMAQQRAYEPLTPGRLPREGFLLAQGKDPKAKDPKDTKEEIQPPATDVFAQAPTAGGEAPSGLNPRMIGDFPGYFSLRTITVSSTQTLTQIITTPITDAVGKVIGFNQSTRTTQVPVNVTTVTRVVNPGHGAFKIADNQSPMPSDRASFTYNYYNGARGPGGDFANPRVVTDQTVMGNAPTTTSTVVPGAPPPRVDLHMETFSLEKSILGGNASVGLRVPIFQQQGDGSASQNDMGDMTVLFNYAFYRDQATGNVLAGGLAVTVPTGPAFDTVAGTFHSTLLQPFGGARVNFDRLYVQGFSSLVVPTDDRDVTTFFNDIGVGYWLRRGGPGQLLSAIIPTVEAHVATPLNHRANTDPMFCPDLLTITTGVHLGLGNRSMLTIGVATPVTGPRVYDVEAIVQFNFRF